MRYRSIVILSMLLFWGLPLRAQQTERYYLSGQGSDQRVEWDFFCTEGRNSGQWTTIPVPSNWELEGFGTYNYGYDKDSIRGREKGLYRFTFEVPSTWKKKDISIVFEGSMTDTEVKINGKLAGPVHQGSFYRFSYPIKDLINFKGENLLEVQVSKQSENISVNKAERKADYWIFGGIFRPVYLEAHPENYIKQVRIDADAYGHFLADVKVQGAKAKDKVRVRIFDTNGELIDDVSSSESATGSDYELETSIKKIKRWSSEFPNLYTAEIALLRSDKIVHVYTEKFGFRSVELKERDGLYLNGKKVKFRGVNRHSFRPETGRALSRQDCIDDVLLIKSMNMNAVRNSHYPADEYFYDACDSLGLLVLDELAGWHDAYDTEVGTILVKEMINANHNHPSIVMWANGNEGGHNTAFDPLFDSLDLQNRPLIHPWKIFRGTNTQHYRDFDYGVGTFYHGHEVVFPTEFLHGLYDGGHGAGLKDNWELMWDLPHSAGGFLWVFADEGVVRTDQGGRIDTDGNHGADGILGPYHEKEGSYYAIKEIWCPLQIEPRQITSAFDGSFVLENRYTFTSTAQCTFTAKLARWSENGEAIFSEFDISAPGIAPGRKDTLKLSLPQDWITYEVLYIEATDPHGQELYTWSWPIQLPDEQKISIVEIGEKPARIEMDSDVLLRITAGGKQYTFNKNNGQLVKVKSEKGEIPFGQGPLLCEGFTGFELLEAEEKEDKVFIQCHYSDTSHFSEVKWTLHPSGILQLNVLYRPSGYFFDMMGISFSYPEELVEGVEWLGGGPYRVWKNRMEGSQLGLHRKAYNNTITGSRDFIYPEFKGYHRNLYRMRIQSREQDFEVMTTTEDLFFRLYTPEFPDDHYNTAPIFPSGDISFMHAIPPIGTKSLKAEQTGPSGRQNIYFDYWPWENRAKEMELYFNFGLED